MSGEVDVSSRLADALAPLSTTDPAEGGDGLRAIGDALTDYRVVGLGEATHGTREFFELKHRVVRHLVEEQGLRLFGIEACFGETLAVNDYVLRGEGSAEDALDGIGFWTWNTEEVRAFVEWLREFNDGREREDCVKFYGYDMQFMRASADRLREYLATVDPELGASLDDDLGLLADEQRSHEDDELRERVETTESVVDALAGALDDNRDSYVDATSEREYRLARQHVTAMDQAITHGRELLQADEYATEEGLRQRDSAMAENVDWILDHTPHDRIALWAHNGHVKRGGMEYEDASVPTMGDHLADRYGDDYYALGFDFHHGSFQAIGDLEDGDDRGLRAFTVDEPKRDSLAAPFADASHPLAFLDFASVNAELTDWLDDEHALRSVGALFDHDEDDDEYWDTCDLTTDFDGLLYVEETTRAVPLGENR